MLTYLAFAIGIVVGIALNEWRSSSNFSKDPADHIVIRKFEFDSQQTIAYNSAREFIENNSDKFQLIKLKCTGNAMFDNRGIFMKYHSLHGHTLKFNYDMSSAEVIDPPKENCNSL